MTQREKERERDSETDTQTDRQIESDVEEKRASRVKKKTIESRKARKTGNKREGLRDKEKDSKKMQIGGGSEDRGIQNEMKVKEKNTKRQKGWERIKISGDVNMQRERGDRTIEKSER